MLKTKVVHWFSTKLFYFSHKKENSWHHLNSNTWQGHMTLVTQAYHRTVKTIACLKSHVTRVIPRSFPILRILQTSFLSQNDNVQSYRWGGQCYCSLTATQHWSMPWICKQKKNCGEVVCTTDWKINFDYLCQMIMAEKLPNTIFIILIMKFTLAEDLSNELSTFCQHIQIFLIFIISEKKKHIKKNQSLFHSFSLPLSIKNLQALDKALTVPSFAFSWVCTYFHDILWEFTTIVNALFFLSNNAI